MEHDQSHEGGQVGGEGGGHEWPAVCGGWVGWPAVVEEWRGVQCIPDTRSWSTLPDMKTPRSNHSLAVVQGRLVAMGGYQGIETTKKVEFLDMSFNT